MQLYPLPLSLHPVSPLPIAVPSGWVLRGLWAAGGVWPTFVFQAAVGLVALVQAVVEAVADEAQVEAEPLVAQVLVPGTALCSAGRDGQAVDGIPLGTLPCPVPQASWETPRCYPLPAHSEDSWQCPGTGVLTLTVGHSVVAGTEAWGTHAAVGDEGDTQKVGVRVEGRGGHIAAKPGGTTRGDTAPSQRCCTLPTALARSPGVRGPTWSGPPELGQDPCCQPPAPHRAPPGRRGRRQCPPH